LNTGVKDDTGSTGSASSIRSEEKNLKTEEIKAGVKEVVKTEDSRVKDLKKFQKKVAVVEKKSDPKLVDTNKAIRRETPTSSRTLPSTNK